MSQSQNSSQRRSWVPATGHGSLRASVRPSEKASAPPFREVPLPDPVPPVRVRSNAPRTINVDAIATPVRNMHRPGAPQADVVRAPRFGSPAAPETSGVMPVMAQLILLQRNSMQNLKWRHQILLSSTISGR